MKGILPAQISSGTNVIESLDLLADDIAGMGKSALQYLQGLDHCLLAHSSPLVRGRWKKENSSAHGLKNCCHQLIDHHAPLNFQLNYKTFKPASAAVNQILTSELNCMSEEIFFSRDFRVVG